MRTWPLVPILLVMACGKAADASSLPACDSPQVQELAREAAAQAVKIPFALSTFSEVVSATTATARSCRVRATHAASGAAIWMRFTVALQPVKKPKKGEPKERLAVTFAPLE